MNRKLRTHAANVTFKLVTEDKDEPTIEVYEGDFCCGSYYLSTIDHSEWNQGDPLDGWCVYSHTYDGHLEVSARTHQNLVNEAHKLLAK